MTKRTGMVVQELASRKKIHDFQMFLTDPSRHKLKTISTYVDFGSLGQSNVDSTIQYHTISANFDISAARVQGNSNTSAG